MGVVTALATVTTLGVGAAGQASAASANFANLMTVGSICLGQVNSYVSTPYNRAGVLGGSVEFVLWTPTFGQPCTVSVTVGWHNLDSGEAGSFTSVVRGNATFQTGSQELDLPTGPGRVAVSLTTDRPHLPVADVEITVP